MNDPIAILKDRAGKAAAKVARAEKALETAKTEYTELQIALRVMAGITGESLPTSSAIPSAAVAERQKTITGLLKVGEENASAPAEIFEAYKVLASEEISIDTFRTTIWRMKNNPFQTGDDVWFVQGNDGLYWKVPASVDTRKRAAAEQAPVAPPTPVQHYDDFDDDSEVPF